MSQPAPQAVKQEEPVWESIKIIKKLQDTLLGSVNLARVEIRYQGNRYPVEVVVKEYFRHCIDNRVSLDGQKVHENALNEIEVHSKISQHAKQRPELFGSRHIVQLHQVRQDDKKVYVFMDFCSRGELLTMLQNESQEIDYLQLFFQLMLGVSFIHSFGFAHLDISPENVLLDEDYTVKLCDFGVALNVVPYLVEETLPDGTKRRTCKVNLPRIGKLKYQAPEVFRGIPFDPLKADIWSCGVVLFTIATRSVLYFRATKEDENFAFLPDNIQDLLKARGQKKLPDDVVDLLSQMLCPEERRITADKVLSHRALKPSLEEYLHREKQVQERARQEQLAQQQQAQLQQAQQQQPQQPPQ